MGIGNTTLQLPPAQQRLAIEAPPLKGNMCVFHLTNGHDGSSCPEMVQYAQMINTREVISELGPEEEVYGQLGDSGIHFLEYESDSDRGGDILVTLGDPYCAILTRGQRQSKNISTTRFTKTVAKGKEPLNQNLENGSRVQEVQMLKCFDLDTSFNIVEFCKALKIKISPAEYLRLNPKELEKIIKYVQGKLLSCNTPKYH